MSGAGAAISGALGLDAAGAAMPGSEAPAGVVAAPPSAVQMELNSTEDEEDDDDDDDDEDDDDDVPGAVAAAAAAAPGANGKWLRFASSVCGVVSGDFWAFSSIEGQIEPK